MFIILFFVSNICVDCFNIFINVNVDKEKSSSEEYTNYTEESKFDDEKSNNKERKNNQSTSERTLCNLIQTTSSGPLYENDLNHFVFDVDFSEEKVRQLCFNDEIIQSSPKGFGKKKSKSLEDLKKIETKNIDFNDDIFFSNEEASEADKNIERKIQSVQSKFLEYFIDVQEFYSDFEECFLNDEYPVIEEYKSIYDLIDFENGRVVHKTREVSNRLFYIAVLLRNIYLVDISQAFQDIVYCVYSLFFSKPPQSSNILKEILLSGELFDFSNVNSESNMYFLINSKKHLNKLFHVFAYDDVYNPILLSDVEIKCEDAMVTKDFTGWGLYINIYGKKCSEIKYLQISFDNNRCSNNFRFKHHDGNLVSDIWMERKADEFDEYEITEINENITFEATEDTWLEDLSGKGYDVFYELKSLPEDLKKYNGRKE